MSSSDFPTVGLDVLQRYSDRSLWARDAQYRALAASAAGYASLAGAERDARGRFVIRRATPTATSPAVAAEERLPWWMAL